MVGSSRAKGLLLRPFCVHNLKVSSVWRCGRVVGTLGGKMGPSSNTKFLEISMFLISCCTTAA
jgi:hypothetical protein